ncbi:hypothetical protein HSR121_2011 [Halapricum desulfuricans]|uniref:Rubrerythrin-like domain-containing protein n=1 Tax=Halapricum desulfuricans TaxID=2841257 RepID=A0A897N0X8_9EURY|nr:hypothetical protein HSR121_2011 [Halapricum desulfuricans]
MIQAVKSPETYSQYKDKLHEGNHLFVCDKCGHYAGDPREHNFLARCPACESIVRFTRIIE